MSTERQYALKEKALELGWAPDQVQLIDEDLGISGAQKSLRQGFQKLVAQVSLGQAGAIFGLEISRLARSSADLLRLLELCALFDTIVVDEDGIYDLSDFNDRLILGFKGTMSEAELHFLHSRLIGGKKNKAHKGELRFPLPVGYCYDEDGSTVFDPDQEFVKR
ncbi:MAG: recombinase family protein [Bacillota bacterium]